MPRKAKRPCRFQGCPNLTDDLSGYCQTHKTMISRHYDKYLRGYNHNERYGHIWRKVRKIFLSANPFCEMCKRDKGILTDATEVHHIKPLSEGGNNSFDNLMPLCKSCHSRITMTAINSKKGLPEN